jgi:hypothetical protein
VIRNTGAKILALIISLGFFGLVFLLSFHAVPQENREIFNVLLGTLATTFVAVTSFFFGSNIGASAKDAMLAASHPPLQPVKHP